MRCRQEPRTAIPPPGEKCGLTPLCMRNHLQNLHEQVIGERFAQIDCEFIDHGRINSASLLAEQSLTAEFYQDTFIYNVSHVYASQGF